jgi:iron complex transport system ATP-binding protein
MLAVQSLSLKLGARLVLRNISLRFDAGQVTVIMGPNGAGKTTLIRVLAGLAGDGVMLDGEALSHFDPVIRAQQIGYLPQGTEPAWNVTARELVALGRLPYRPRFAGPNASDEAAIERALLATDTIHLADRTLHAMSGGERARVLLARVLAGEPRWLLADEPMASLDPAHRLDIAALLRTQALQGVGVITVLHDLSLAARVADRIVLMQDGKVAAAGPPEAVLIPATLASVYGITADISLSSDGKLNVVPAGRS